MKSKLLFILLLLSQLYSFANPISLETARQHANTFLTKQLNRGIRKAPSRLVSKQLIPAVQHENYYIFNVGRSNGYVIVSGSDKTQPILGYTDQGTLDIKNMPLPMQEWLNELATAIKSMEKGVRTPKRIKRVEQAHTSTTKNVVPALVQTKWNQGDPYNALCPPYQQKDGTSGISATGCVATAMAQILGYWKYPTNEVPEIPAYTYNFEGKNYTLEALAPFTIDWKNITDTYSSNSSKESKEAISQLMRHIGQSVYMGYGPSSGAGINNIAPALIKYFGYAPSLHFEAHDNYSYQEWEDLIYQEIAAGRPIVMNATTSEGGGGHEFVLDGYDGNGYFHVNWGWGGMNDGYFLLTVMSPDSQGIGGSSSADGYSMGQGVVVGIQPAADNPLQPEEIPHISVSNIRLDKTTYTRKSAKAYFMPKITYAAGTNMKNSYEFNAAFTLYDEDGNIVKETIGTESFPLSPGTWWPTRAITTMFGPDLPDGIYYIKGRSRKKGTQEWVEDDNFNTCYVIAEIKNETTLNLAVYPVFDINVNSLDLIGNSSVGTEQQVKVNITNNGNEYYNQMFLLEDGVWKSGNNVFLPAGKTTDIYFKYKPTTKGTHTLALSKSKDKKDIFYTTTKVISEATKGNLAIVMTPMTYVENTGGSRCIYGDQMNMEVKVYNKAQSPYIGHIEVSPWELTDGYYWKRGSTRQNINLPAGADTTLVYHIKDLNIGGRYNFHADSQESGSSNCGDFDIKTGIEYWTADGVKHGVANNTNFEVTKEMVAVYMPGIENPGVLSFGKEYNKNLIVYYSQGAKLSNRKLNFLKKKINNIVFGNTAEKIILSDGDDLYIPKNFNAQNITYTHQVDNNLTPTNGWSTLALPFAPQTIMADGESVNWFLNSEDTGKNLVIKEFSAIRGNLVYFEYAQKLHANRPYIVSYAGNINGSTFNHSGKTITYSATNVNVEAVERISTYSTDYKYLGTTKTDRLDNAYLLSADGTQFLMVSQATVNPFQAFFVANNLDAQRVKSLTVMGENIQTGINATSTQMHEKRLNIYHINGTKVAQIEDSSIAEALNKLPKGVYIINGKKYMK